jgi:AcrR family transcriptional regulator
MVEGVTKNRRINRTKTAIYKALVELIGEKGFNAVTVSDISDRADINRGTFYKHYRDKFDLLDQIEAEIINDVEGIVLQAQSLNFADFNSNDNPLPIVVSIFEYMKDNSALINSILGVEGDTAYLYRLGQAVEKNLKLGFLAGLRAKNFLVPAEYLISYAIFAHFGVIRTWLKNDCRETPREMAIILSKLSMHGPLQMSGYQMPPA